MSTAALRCLLGSAPPSSEGWKPEVTLHVTSELTDDWQGTVRWSLETLEGEVLEVGEESVTVPALSSVCVCELDFTDQLTADASAAPSTTLSAGNRREIVLVYELWQNDERLSMGVVPFLPDKHLKLSIPNCAALSARRMSTFGLKSRRSGWPASSN